MSENSTLKLQPLAEEPTLTTQDEQALERLHSQNISAVISAPDSQTVRLFVKEQNSIAQLLSLLENLGVQVLNQATFSVESAGGSAALYEFDVAEKSSLTQNAETLGYAEEALNAVLAADADDDASTSSSPSSPCPGAPSSCSAPIHATWRNSASPPA